MAPSLRRALLGVSAVLLVVAAMLVPTSVVASGETIHPGTMMFTGDSQCTANFAFTDAAGNIYVGYAAHCAGTGSDTDTNGCTTGSLPLGTPVTFSNSGNAVAGSGQTIGRGVLAYSSWLTEHVRKTTDPNTCAYNDLALVKVDVRRSVPVSPTVPTLGGPTGVARTALPAGAKVFSYGNSSLRGGIAALSPEQGVSLGDVASDGGWEHTVELVPPAIPGDSGSAVLDAQGRAVGVLSTIGVTPPSNGVGDFARELAFAQAYSGIPGLRLVHGTAFSGGGSPLDLVAGLL